MKIRITVSAVLLFGLLAFGSDANNKATFNVAATATHNAYISTFDDAMPHIASGGAWTTKFTLLNFRSATVVIPVQFTDDSGRSLRLPLIGYGTAAGVNISVPPKGSVVFETEYQPNAPTVVGMARLDIPCDSIDACGDVGGFAVFKWRNPGKTDQEAVVPLMNSEEKHALIAFDNRNGYITGVALSIPHWISYDNGDPASVNVIIRDGSANVIKMDTLQMAVDGHMSFVLGDKYPQVVGRSGTVEFVTTGALQYVTALGLQFNPSGAFTTSPSYQPSN